MREWLVALLFGAGCASPQPPHTASAESWLLRAQRIYVAPDVPPLDDAWVLVRGSVIEALGTGEPPAGARVASACSGGTVLAGFQNSHVHVFGPAVDPAATLPAPALEQSLREMFTRFGFTTVVDTGSMIENTAALRARIERGELAGPRILTAGLPLYPVNGIPFYLRGLPPELLQRLPQPASLEQAASVVARNFSLGAQGTKLFIATPQDGGAVARMAPALAQAAARETHRRAGLVMTHPTDVQGVRDSVAAGADIVVHTTIDPPNAAWSQELVSSMVAAHVSLVPTLMLWRYELDRQGAGDDAQAAVLDDARRELVAFSSAGGQVLFGTDVGYMDRVDPTQEYLLMARAGLTPMQILASLTTAPAARWKEEARRGRVAAGLDADLVVLDGDPAVDVQQLARVRCTIRGGRPLFSRDVTAP
jgi:imidazolonepropionase-like amidohydrolase